LEERTSQAGVTKGKRKRKNEKMSGKPEGRKIGVQLLGTNRGPFKYVKRGGWVLGKKGRAIGGGRV